MSGIGMKRAVKNEEGSVGGAAKRQATSVEHEGGTSSSLQLQLYAAVTQVPRQSWERLSSPTETQTFCVLNMRGFGANASLLEEWECRDAHHCPGPLAKLRYDLHEGRWELGLKNGQVVHAVGGASGCTAEAAMWPPGAAVSPFPVKHMRIEAARQSNLNGKYTVECVHYSSYYQGKNWVTFRHEAGGLDLVLSGVVLSVINPAGTSPPHGAAGNLAGQPPAPALKMEWDRAEVNKRGEWWGGRVFARWRKKVCLLRAEVGPEPKPELEEALEPAVELELQPEPSTQAEAGAAVPQGVGAEWPLGAAEELSDPSNEAAFDEECLKGFSGSNAALVCSLLPGWVVASA